VYGQLVGCSRSDQLNSDKTNGRTIWNSLLENVISAPFMSTFRQHIKTSLLSVSFPGIILDSLSLTLTSFPTPRGSRSDFSCVASSESGSLRGVVAIVLLVVRDCGLLTLTSCNSTIPSRTKVAREHV